MSKIHGFGGRTFQILSQSAEPHCRGKTSSKANSACYPSGIGYVQPITGVNRSRNDSSPREDKNQIRLRVTVGS